MSQYVPLHLRREVRQRASQLCEYCLIHEDDVILPHEPDHIIAVKHGGPTTTANLAWTCFLCNRAKGSDIASVDVATGEIIRLFSPRTDKWDEHFEIKGVAIVGKSPIGRLAALSPNCGSVTTVNFTPLPSNSSISLAKSVNRRVKRSML